MLNHIRALRLRNKLRQRDVAAKLRISDHQIRTWERGLALPPPSIMEAIAALFGVAPSVLWEAQESFMHSVAPGEGYTTAKPNSSKIEFATDLPSPNRLKVLDLFCGTGGLSYGLELTQRFTTVAGLDLLPDRVATFRANHPHATGVTADIRDISLDALCELAKEPDVIVGGPPCQGFSSIRPFRTLTEKDSRNSLIEYFVLALSVMRPRWFVFENVVGLLTHRKGMVFAVLIERIQACGYEVTWRVMNAALYESPKIGSDYLSLGIERT